MSNRYNIIRRYRRDIARHVWLPGLFVLAANAFFLEDLCTVRARRSAASISLVIRPPFRSEAFVKNLDILSLTSFSGGLL